MTILLPLFSAILPFFLWPLELVLPYPHIVEELAKLGLVWVLLQSELSGRQKILMAGVIGGIFGFSESVLYLFNIFISGGLGTYLLRLATAVPMHIVTSVVIILPALRSRKLIWIGLVGAIVIHASYNLWVSGL